MRLYESMTTLNRLADISPLLLILTLTPLFHTDQIWAYCVTLTITFLGLSLLYRTLILR